MNTYNEIHNPTFADFKLLRPSATLHFPHSIECGSRWQTFGSSSGWTTDIASSALGEHFERKHFYLDVPVHDTGTLDDGLTSQEYDDFIKAFSQTKNHRTRADLASHVFDRTNVYRIVDFTRCKVPTACISISACLNPIDNHFYPMRDTCGCSAHISVERALLGALKEAMERQFLLRFWLTNTCTEKIGHDESCAMLLGRSCLSLFKELCKTGEICVLDLTDKRFPGSCIFLSYGNQNDNAKVKYCAGMAYAESLDKALEKSIVELWQTFRFMLSFDQANIGKTETLDPYIKHFLECNRYETFGKTSSPTKLAALQHHKIQPDTLSLSSLLPVVRRLEINGYFYLASLPTKGPTLYFCKYLSPKLFLHMNNASNFNLENTYSAPFLDQIIKNRLIEMVPFP